VNQPIGIFDSGIGGLTVAQKIHDFLPDEQIIYFGDTAHFPYGDKSTAAIQAYSVKICNVLLNYNCKVIVIACNSASSAAYELVKEYVGDRAEVINVVDPVVDYVANHHSNDEIGIIGTKRTIKSNIYETKLRSKNQGLGVHSLATPLLAPMIEEGFFNNSVSDKIIEEYLTNPTLGNINALVLGCTHYPLIKEEIEKYYDKRVEVIDSATIVAQSLKQLLEKKELLSTAKMSNHHFYVSDFTQSFEQSTQIFYKEKISLELYNLW
jgi:glutamate racemase